MSEYSNQFLRALIGPDRPLPTVAELAKETGISRARLRYYNDQNKVPVGTDLTDLLDWSGMSLSALTHAMGQRTFGGDGDRTEPIHPGEPVLRTDLGRLFEADCLTVLRHQPEESIDLVFADPPFNLKKLYPSGIDDNLREAEYLRWCERWIVECIRTLRWGGSFFLWNLPRWNSILAGLLERHLTFRHWIAVDLKYSLPIPGRLYPAHYSLLYYVKGPRPNVFAPDRLPMPICPKCLTDLRDYGGYKSKMNPAGINLSDIWYDFSPVRHSKYKKREGANELPIGLLDRVLEMASEPGQLIFDPFGGAGTTYAVAEIKNRRWLGTEIGPTADILDRFDHLQEEQARLHGLRGDLNCLFRREHKERRMQLGLWTDESFS